MAYVKNTWIDRVGVTRYFESIDDDGAKILNPDYSQLTEIGTPVNADNMNHIEEGIAAGSFTKFDLKTTYAKDDLITTIEDGSPVIYKSLIDNNIGNALSNTDAWKKISLGGSGLDGKITNCITEIPQRIKVEKTTDGFVLKAGSQAIVPSGFEDDGVTPKFEYVTFESDVSFPATATVATQWVVYHNPSTQTCGRIETYYTESGTSSTLTTQWRVWYDTANNVVKRTDNSGATWVSGFSLPIMLMTNNGSKWTSVDTVFNGFGYIGQCLWVDKGVKALFADGRNEDGTLKNKEVVTTKIKINDETGLSSKVATFDSLGNIGSYGVDYYFVQDTPPTNWGNANARWFDTQNNLCYVTSNSGTTWNLEKVILLGSLMKTNTGNFTSMSIRKPLRVVDYGDLKEVVSIVETYKNGNSWYRVWSDGWVEQGGYKGANTNTITFLKSFKDYSYYLNILCIRNERTSGGYQWVSGRTPTNATLLLNEEPGFWYACGYKA